MIKRITIFLLFSSNISFAQNTPRDIQVKKDAYALHFLLKKAYSNSYQALVIRNIPLDDLKIGLDVLVGDIGGESLGSSLEFYLRHHDPYLINLYKEELKAVIDRTADTAIAENQSFTATGESTIKAAFHFLLPRFPHISKIINKRIPSYYFEYFEATSTEALKTLKNHITNSSFTISHHFYINAIRAIEENSFQQQVDDLNNSDTISIRPFAIWALGQIDPQLPEDTQSVIAEYLGKYERFKTSNVMEILGQVEEEI